jgi:hypothetical protein
MISALVRELLIICVVILALFGSVTASLWATPITNLNKHSRHPRINSVGLLARSNSPVRRNSANNVCSRHKVMGCSECGSFLINNSGKGLMSLLSIRGGDYKDNVRDNCMNRPCILCSRVGLTCCACIHDSSANNVN